MSAITNPLAPDESTPPPAPPKAMRLETDTFCEHCHYNLFGQAVTLDPQLQILISRCPECGRFHPAGRGVSASRVWLNRFGLFMLVVWVLFCLALVAIGSCTLGAIQYGYLDSFTEYIQQTPDGQNVTQQWSPAGKYVSVIEGTNQVAPVVISKRIIQFRRPWQQDEPLWEILMPYWLVSTIASICLGVLFSVAFWHWKRRAFFSLLLPLFIGTFVFTIWRTELGVSSILGWSIAHIAMWSFYDMAILAACLIFGRGIARLIVSLVIPAKPRQHFAFLWAADGKKWPFPITINPPAHQENPSNLG